MKRTLVLSDVQWNNITKHIDNNSKLNARRNEDLNYENYLKNGSRAMTKHWENSVEKIREQMNKEREKAVQQKKIEGLYSHCCRCLVCRVLSCLFS